MTNGQIRKCIHEKPLIIYAFETWCCAYWCFTNKFLKTLFFACTCLVSMLQKSINRPWIFLIWRSQSTNDFLKSTWRMKVDWKILLQTGRCHSLQSRALYAFYEGRSMMLWTIEPWQLTATKRPWSLMFTALKHLIC